MEIALWYLVTGGVLVAIALASPALKRRSVFFCLFYLLFGFLVGPAGVALVRQGSGTAPLLPWLAKLATLLCLFSAGLRLSRPKAGLSLPILVVGVLLLASLAALGETAGLDVFRETSPTHGSDNPLHRLLPYQRHDALDAAWMVLESVGVGLLLGGVLALLSGRQGGESERKLDNPLLLGLLALAAGVAVLLHGHGPLTALAAGVVLRRFEPGEDDELKEQLEDLEDEEDEQGEAPPLPVPAFLLPFKEAFQERATAIVAFVAGGLLSLVAPACLSWLLLLALLAAKPASTSGTLLGGGSPRFKLRDVLPLLRRVLAVSKVMASRVRHQPR